MFNVYSIVVGPSIIRVYNHNGIVTNYRPDQMIRWGWDSMEYSDDPVAYSESYHPYYTR